MPDCPKLIKCPFFNDKMANKPAMAELFKKQFCLTDNSKCARFLVSSADKTVPPDLYPNQLERVKILTGK
jgi:hypothetical protein